MAPRRSTLLAGLLAAVLTGPTPAAAATAATPVRWADIPGDGVILKANVVAPAAAGRHPAVIFPSSWGLNDLEYLAQARAMAAAGYVVVSYTPRGWWSSGGEIDTSGPKDMADLSHVIDWTVANTPADPARIGAAGVSYGGGIALLGAGFDRRIRAVGMLSGWTDLVYSMYSGQTRHKQSVGLLELAAEMVGNPGPELSGKLADFAADRNADEVEAWARLRSPDRYLDAINSNGPAVLIANSWGDSVFPPNPLASFYERLTVAKRLELRPGDHAITELTGLAGLPNDVWASLRGWFDEYLGDGNGGVPADQVLVKPDNAAAETYGAWSGLSDQTGRYGLGAIRRWDGTGPLGGSPTTGWSKALPADLDTVAGGGVVLLTNSVAAFTGVRPQVWLPVVDRLRAGVWTAGRAARPLRIRGAPRVHLELSGTAATGSLVAYLYDVDALGAASLITHAPVTWLGGTAGDRTVEVDLFAAAHDVPAGHALTLVIDTVDPLYYDANRAGGTVTVAGGSYLDIPIG